jgi:trimethylamine--corrinoid protein Co-methyltransferase
VVEPVDVPVAIRHLAAYQAHIECSDIVWAARGIGGVQAQDAIAMSAIEHGCSVEDLASRPTLMTVTNVNSPRRVDEEILDNIMIMARHGQCVVITPFTLMGAMAPVTLAGALVQQSAEAMCVIALCQMLRPGTPCVMGGFTSNVDMRTGSPAFGTPEYVNAVLATAQIGRRLKIPVRTSAVNASPAVDAQSTYETAFSLQAAILSHSHLINHATGWLEGGLSASLEKIIVDAEMLRSWAEIFKPVDFNDDDLGVDAIKGVAAGGHFFGTAHTLARYEHAFYRPLLSDWSNFENWSEAGARDATQRATGIWKKLLAEYVPPPLDPAVKEAIDAYVARTIDALRADETAALRVNMTAGIMNARMYAVTPEVEAGWRRLLTSHHGRGGRDAHYMPYPAPQPLEDLWSRAGSGVRLHVRLPHRLEACAGHSHRSADPASRVGGGPCPFIAPI